MPTLTKAVYMGQIPTQAEFIDRISMLFDSSYPTGGEDLDLATLLPARTIISVIAGGWPGYTFQYVPATGKLIAIDAATDVEVVNATDLSGITALNLTVFSE